MNKQERKEKYPVLSIRIKPEEKAYIIREAAERKLSKAEYVRKVLFPFELSTEK